jgi:membrane-associated phospholipid phosphatase
MRRVPPARLAVLGVAASAGFVSVAWAIAARRTRQADGEVRMHLQEVREGVGDEVAAATNPLGKEWLHFPLAAGLTALLGWRGLAWRYAVLPSLASAAAETLSRALDRVPPHRTPPPGHPNPQKPSFPSGHALETTAVALTCAYVLAREDLVPPTAAFSGAAVLAALSSGGRLYLDRHWISDTAGGTLAGLAIASGCAALYEARTSRRPSRLSTRP